MKNKCKGLDNQIKPEWVKFTKKPFVVKKVLVGKDVDVSGTETVVKTAICGGGKRHILSIERKQTSPALEGKFNV